METVRIRLCFAFDYCSWRSHMDNATYYSYCATYRLCSKLWTALWVV